MSESIDIRPSVSDTTRRALETIGSHLIPEAHGMPAAGTIGVGTTQLDIVLASRPDLGPPIERALANANLDDIDGFVAALEVEDAEAHGAVTLAIVAGYYMHPTVHELIGYPGQVPKDAQRLGEREIYQDGLMDLAAKVIERGPVYRPTPEIEETQ
jgi:hypothetical protein